MDFSNIPTVGWIVLAFIAVLIFVVLIFLLRRGIKFGIGNNSLSIGQTKEVNEKIEELKTEITQKEKDRLHDEELRKALFRQSGIIDEKEKADERRVIRNISTSIKEVFHDFVKCEMPLLTLVENIKDILQERVDYNNLRENLSRRERTGYLEDVVYKMQKAYEQFLFRVPNVPCSQEAYPDWERIKPKLVELVNAWAVQMVEVINTRISEKISLYESRREDFILDEYKQNACDYPIRKNKKYLKDLNENALRNLI